MKMNFIDIMVCILYKFHRKKNEQSIASIFAKAIWALLIYFLFIAIYKTITNTIPFESLYKTTGFFEKKIAGFLLFAPFFVLSLLITSKSKRYEEYELSDIEYKKGWGLLCGLVAILVLLFLYTIAR